MSRWARDRAHNERLDEWSPVDIAELIDLGAVESWPLLPHPRWGFTNAAMQRLTNQSRNRPLSLGPWTGGVTPA